MTRHIADRDHSEPGSARVRNFTRIEREERPSEASKILQTRPESRESTARVKAYMEIERGRRA